MLRDLLHRRAFHLIQQRCFQGLDFCKESQVIDKGIETTKYGHIKEDLVFRFFKYLPVYGLRYSGRPNKKRLES